MKMSSSNYKSGELATILQNFSIGGITKRFAKSLLHILLCNFILGFSGSCSRKMQIMHGGSELKSELALSVVHSQYSLTDQEVSSTITSTDNISNHVSSQKVIKKFKRKLITEKRKTITSKIPRVLQEKIGVRTNEDSPVVKSALITFLLCFFLNPLNLHLLYLGRKKYAMVKYTIYCVFLIVIGGIILATYIPGEKLFFGMDIVEVFIILGIILSAILWEIVELFLLSAGLLEPKNGVYRGGKNYD